MVNSAPNSIDGLGFRHKRHNMEAAVSILESFVNGVRSQRADYHNVSFLDVKDIVDRVLGELQSIPENVSELESRLYAVEQAADRFSQ
jgi:hypothetical protein